MFDPKDDPLLDSMPEGYEPAEDTLALLDGPGEHAESEDGEHEGDAP